ncbi:MAG: ferredoxin family protein, partial [Kiritimatiellia bacterium]
VSISKIHCKGCGLCIAICRSKSLKLGKVYNQQGQPTAEFTSDGTCTGCRQCAIICPDAAIEIEQIEDKTKQTKKPGRKRKKVDDR